MKVSEQWLREWVNPAISTDELSSQFSMAGLEVDAVESAAPPFEGVVVGEVRAVEPHPDADKLRVCRVFDGEAEQDVVCGAPNVVAGMKAPYARVGATLPDGTRIRKAKLRGVASAGMLCGADELGLAEEREGLMALPAELPAGSDLRSALALDDALIDIDLTPNRGDCLSVRGLAREVSVLNDCELVEPAIVPVPATIDDTFPVTVADAAGCPRYLGRVIRGVAIDRPTPAWMTEKLRRSGVRPIDPVVDVTNYVLLELGQPMHAFDLARLTDGIEVRRARPNERLTLLDGSEIELDDDTLLITDGAGPVAMAGIMGGAGSGVATEGAERTRDVFLECAFFSPVAVAGRARRHGLHTEASHRYERGVDFRLQHLAMERATRLLLDIVGGEPGPVTEWVDPDALPPRPAITLRAARLRQLLGMTIPAGQVDAMLARLGLPILGREETADGVVWSVQAPSWRFDLEREADLVEEVARIYGYDNVVVTAPSAAMHLAPTHESRTGADAVRDRLVGRGMQEILAYSFVDAALNDRLDPAGHAARLANPISADLAVMRTSLWPGLVKTWMANRNRQQTRARLFEVGRTFALDADGGEPVEHQRVAGLLAGTREPEGWNTADDEVDFFDARGLVEDLIDLTRDAGAFRFERGEHPALHPGQCARVLRHTEAGEVEVGLVGAIHPEVQAALDLPRPVQLFELDLDVLAPRRPPQHRGLSRFPSVRRDIALELDATVPAQQVVDTVHAAGDPRIRDVWLFDVYQGEPLPPGRRSLALAVVMQDPERTLEEAEVGRTIDALVERLGEALGAQRR